MKNIKNRVVFFFFLRESIRVCSGRPSCPTKGCDFFKLSEGRYDETFAGEDAVG